MAEKEVQITPEVSVVLTDLGVVQLYVGGERFRFHNTKEGFEVHLGNNANRERSFDAATATAHALFNTES